MKPKIITLVLIAIVHTGCSRQNKQAAGIPRSVVLGAMQMQEAVLKSKDIQKVEALLKGGVDINAPIGCGDYAPLDGAVDTKNFEMLKFLLAHGAKPKGRELADAAFIRDPQTALKFVEVLLSTGVNPNAMNNYSTPLVSAAYRNNRDVVALLLSQPGIKVDAQEVDGHTALMWAADHGSLGLVNLLLRAGADPNIKDDRGETAISLAERHGAVRGALIARLQSSTTVYRTLSTTLMAGCLLFAVLLFSGVRYFVSERAESPKQQTTALPVKKPVIEEVEGGTPCVSCRKRIAGDSEICPFCGWTQPERVS